MAKTKSVNKTKKKPTKVAKSVKVAKVVSFKKPINNKSKKAKPIIGFVAILLLLIVGIFFGYKKDVSLLLVESKTGTVVAGAEVLFNGKQYTSDETGLVQIKKVGMLQKKLLVFKPFYEDASDELSIRPLTAQKQKTVTMRALGEVVRVQVKNRLNDEPVQGADVKASSGGSGRTNKDGSAVLVLPDGTNNTVAKVTGPDILDVETVIFNANDATTNQAKVIPKGKVYFLQKTAAGIVVMQSNIDGSDKKEVVAGAGFEDESDTQLLISPQASYAALKARRSAGRAGLYMFDGTDNTFTPIEEDSQSYIPVGWQNTSFVYLVYRPSTYLWQNGREVLKSYNAATKQTIVLNETRGEGSGILDYAGESFENIYMLEGKVFYTKKWQSSYYYGARFVGKKMTLNSVAVNGDNQNTISEWQAGYNASIKTVQSSAAGLNIFIELDGVNRSYYTYIDGKTSPVSVVGNDFINKDAHPLYFVSPSGHASVWSQKTSTGYATYTGDNNSQKSSLLLLGANGFKVTGWYTDNYLLAVDESQQLYIVSRRGALPSAPALKISQSFVPTVHIRSFGYGR